MSVDEDHRLGCHSHSILPYVCSAVDGERGAHEPSECATWWESWRNVTPVRIAQVSDCFAPRTGGIETQVGSLSVRQAAAGHDVQVITATPDAGAEDASRTPEGVLIHRLTARIPFELPVHPRTVSVITEVLAANPVDVMHVHVGVVSPFAWGAIRAARRLEIPVLVTVHSMWGHLARPGYTMAERLSGYTRHRVLLSGVSSAAADRVSRSLPSVGPVRIIPNGIDEEVWAAVDSDASSVRERSGPLEVVSVMRMAPRKRTLPLVRIAEDALTRGADLHLTLVGDGPERAQAERYVRRHGLDDAIQFTGRLSGSQIRALYRSSDLFIQPSIQESFGIAALEARTAGLPVLARSQTGTVDFIRDGTEGVIVDDDDSMTRALMQLAADRDTVARMSQHNRAVLPEQVWSRVLGEVDAAYAVAISREDLG